jgi:hypothetical protein
LGLDIKRALLARPCPIGAKIRRPNHVRTETARPAWVLVDGDNFAENHSRAPLLPEDCPDRRPDLTGRQDRCGNLIEQRLKRMVVISIDERLSAPAFCEAPWQRPVVDAAALLNSLALGSDEG